VLNGALLWHKIIRITFEESFEIDKYNDEVTTYKVKDDGKLVSIFYADFSRRETQWRLDDFIQITVCKDEINERPHISIV
jgi:peptidyl-dipeptidase Dcp